MQFPLRRNNAVTFEGALTTVDGLQPKTTDNTTGVERNWAYCLLARRETHHEGQRHFRKRVPERIYRIWACVR